MSTTTDLIIGELVRAGHPLTLDDLDTSIDADPTAIRRAVQLLSVLGQIRYSYSGRGHARLIHLTSTTPTVDIARTIAPPPPLWHAEAACRGMNPDLFFPERGDSTREAKAVCATCPVVDPCLRYALDNGEKFGIWGGVPERGRRILRRNRPPTDQEHTA